eukprot:TRINITY_DN5762_c0_g2_i1.p1 TRINITY_DN5762_c0_g2~~TRINITY_DN5762_c0_g2_i1.p1  ORF type:complete len:143 (+),score=37.96 TRINITY_DN5762_c0_g2_i1:122-550(+)
MDLAKLAQRPWHGAAKPHCPQKDRRAELAVLFRMCSDILSQEQALWFAQQHSPSRQGKQKLAAAEEGFRQGSQRLSTGALAGPGLLAIAGSSKEEKHVAGKVEAVSKSEHGMRMGIENASDTMGEVGALDAEKNQCSCDQGM